MNAKYADADYLNVWNEIDLTVSIVKTAISADQK